MEERWTVPSETPPAEEHPRHSRARDARLILTGIALALLVWFAVVNLQQVQIRFWVRTAAAPLIVVIIISGFLGAAVTSLWGWLRRRRRVASDDPLSTRSVEPPKAP
jgi:uncharacterized integral membrane protein